MSATLNVLFEAEPCLEGDVADGEADRPTCHQLGQISVLRYFRGTAGVMDHQHVFRHAGFLGKYLPQRLHWTGKQGKAASGRWSGALGRCLLS